ncbi:RloB domain-containing protein [Chitinophaga pinensis]|uniref:RloB domain-containing protein n=1 Tax=Chitinophaga pinensis TaxID=79329 RepID=A0A5C6LRV6_9BACT|nr:RloB domain-containing protein [Chitinophaga pinensis]TWV99347.1 RloB domain-containing protein [Chitinophaga pinensis]
MSQPIRKTLLIVCEGTETEPGYFDGLRNLIIDSKLPYWIKISPKPTEEIKREEKAQQEEAGTAQT